MKRRLSAVLALLFLLLFISAPYTYARDVAPIVDTAWVEKNTANPKVVIVDVRKVEEYKAGHIPNAVNVFYGSWAVGKGGLKNEAPMADDLFDVIGSAGIGANSIVVIVGKYDKIPDRADVSRVAWTLKYAGIQNIAILDGGYNKWVADKKPVSTDAVKPKSTTYKGKVNDKLFANKDYVMSKLGKAVLVDSREEEFYTGKKKLDFVERAGHIKGAVNLPTSLAFNQDGTFKKEGELKTAAEKAAGKAPGKEIIVYCDTGKIATFWAFLFTDLMGYRDVKVYDGSTEEWSKDPKAPMVQ